MRSRTTHEGLMYIPIKVLFPQGQLDFLQIHIKHFTARKPGPKIFFFSLSRTSKKSDENPGENPAGKITCSKLTTEAIEQGTIIFSVNNKNTRTKSMASFWCLYC